jgi:hypothetical protein
MGRFRNWTIMAIELVVALFVFGAFTVTTIGHRSILGIFWAFAGIALLWSFRCELRGISIGSSTLTMPTRPIPWMPILSFGRRIVLLSEVHTLTLSAPWFGFEVIKISGDFGWHTLVFGSKNQRRRFTELIQSLCQHVAVYRSRP